MYLALIFNLLLYDQNFHRTRLNPHLQCEQLLYYHLHNNPNHYNESITGHKKLKKLDNVKIGHLKKKNRDHKKYLHKMKMLVTCNSTTYKIPILTAACVANGT